VPFFIVRWKFHCEISITRFPTTSRNFNGNCKPVYADEVSDWLTILPSLSWRVWRRRHHRYNIIIIILWWFISLCCTNFPRRKHHNIIIIIIVTARRETAAAAAIIVANIMTYVFTCRLNIAYTRWHTQISRRYPRLSSAELIIRRCGRVTRVTSDFEIIISTSPRPQHPSAANHPPHPHDIIWHAYSNTTRATTV